MMERVRAAVPELPLARRRRFVEQFGLSDYEAGVLTDQQETADYFERCLGAGATPRSAANWIMKEVLHEINERRIPIAEFEVGPERLAELLGLLDSGKVNAQAARDVMAELVRLDDSAVTAVETVKSLGLEQISDESALQAAVEQAIAENPKMVQDYLAGRKQAVGALVGQVMRATRGKADPKLVNQLLSARLEAMGRETP